MTYAALLAVGLASLGFRLAFTVLADADRLPAFVRSRLDVVGPATFAALLATTVAGAVGDPRAVPLVGGLAAAALVATRTSQVLAPVATALVVASALSLT